MDYTFAEWLAPFLEQGSWLVLPLVVAGGVLTAFNPCCLPMYPAVFGFLGGECCRDCATDGTVAVAPPTRTIAWMFVLGIATTTTAMGLFTAGLGWVFGQFPVPVRLAFAVVPLLMGLHLLGLFPLTFPAWRLHMSRRVGENRTGSWTRAYAAGSVFTLAITPCATPILSSILLLVALEGDLAYSAVLMFIYGVGTGLPVILIGRGFERFQFLYTGRARFWLRRLSGLLLLGVAVYIVSTL